MENITADVNGWVDELIAKLDAATGGILEVKIGNETVSAFVGEEVVNFFNTNKILLIRLGKDLFRSFLLLLHEKRDEEAFNILLSKMEADQIIGRMLMNAAQLQEMNDDYDKFMAALRKWAVTFLTALMTRLLIGLLI